MNWITAHWDANRINLDLFKIQKNMKLLYPYFFCIGLIAISSCSSEDEAPKSEIEIPEGYTLVWQDEFNESVVNTNNWNYETGDGTAYGLPVGWGNNEKQIYTMSEENVHVATEGEVSSMMITAREDGAGAYTSAKLVTKDLFSMRFGRIDVKAMMAEGQGVWPAIWMLGDNIDMIQWPGCGEIDIAEVLGHQTTISYSTLHFTNGENKHEETQKIHELSSGSFSDSYHVFSVDWSPETIIFLIDDVVLQEVVIKEDMKEFLRSFYLILNVAVGGYWPGEPDNTTVFPQSMAVDYVRVFSKDGFVSPEAPVLDIAEETVGQLIAPNVGDHAIKEGFSDLGNLSVVSYGGGGEPIISSSETAIDGPMSLAFDFPGDNWGGGYIELAATADMSGYDFLKFSLKKSAALVNAEIKLESPKTNKAVFLKDYAGTAVANEFLEYSIPLSDFTGLDLTEISVPFSIWNPQDANEGFVASLVLIDNLYFSK